MHACSFCRSSVPECHSTFAVKGLVDMHIGCQVASVELSF